MARRNTVRANYVHNYKQMLNDGGCVYTQVVLHLTAMYAPTHVSVDAASLLCPLVKHSC